MQAKPNILIVDDEIANLTMFNLLCRDLFTVHGVRTVNEAVVVMQGYDIFLALVDHRLGHDMTGLAFFESLTCSKVLLSSEADMAQWVATHGGEWLRKPLDFLLTKKRLRALAAKYQPMPMPTSLV